MSATNDVLAGLHAALVDAFLSAGIPTPSRDRVLPTSMIELEADGAEVYGSLFDGDGAVDNVVLGGGGTGGDLYEITHRAEFDWAVSDYEDARRLTTFDQGLIAIDDAVKALDEAVRNEGHPLFGTLSAAAIERVDRTRTVFDGIPHIKAAVVTVALTFTSDRPF